VRPHFQPDSYTGGPGRKRVDVDEIIRYAAYRGVAFSPTYMCNLLRRLDRRGTQRYIDHLGEIMDAAAELGIECRQSLASRRLSIARGDAQCVIDAFAAQARRRTDRQIAGCSVPVPPRSHQECANAFANCGCPRCRERLAMHMQPFITRLVKSRLCDGLDSDEARSEANVELVEAVDTWPGGNFTGWFRRRFEHRVYNFYAACTGDERHTISLNVEESLSNDRDGHIVPLYERVPDRTIDVLRIVLLRERAWEGLFARYGECTVRLREYAKRQWPARASHDLHARRRGVSTIGESHELTAERRELRHQTAA
jgi:hypothetical protein